MAILIVGLALISLAGYAFVVEPNAVRVTRMTLHFPDLPPEADGLVIAHLSDLHLHRVGERERKLLRIVDANPADIIAITGDLVTRIRHTQECLEFLGNLDARLGVWAVQGNWEHYTGWTGERLRGDLAEAGTRLLLNEAEPLLFGNATIWLAGTDDPSLHADRIPQALNGTENGWVMLLAHSPEALKRAPPNVRLMLSGHTHGGQIRLPLLGAPWARSMGGGYESGLYQRDDTSLYVTNGLGMTILPARFLCPPEVVYITLVRGRP